MAEDTQNNTGTAVPGESLTPVQQEALTQGWVPKEEYEGDADKWVDAGEFLRRGELFRKIESQSKEMKELRKAINGLAQHNAKIREIEYKRALDDLKAQKKEALSEGDADKVVDIDDRIDYVKEQQKISQTQQVQEVVQSVEVHPELQSWINKNPWYESNQDMRKFADKYGAALAGEMAPTEVLKEVEKAVKERFKDKFRNPNRDRAGAVEGVTNRPGRASSEADYELSDVEKTVMNTLVKGGHLTKDEYIKQLKAVKGQS